MPTSLTELDAVKPKGPRIFIALVAALSVAAGVWFFVGRNAQGPIGEPEDAARVVLLGAEADVAQVLPQLGLDVEATDLKSLAERGRDEGAPAEASAVDAALYWADLHGYGYVAFANPSAVDFGTRPVSTDSADLHDAHGFAVFSVGDFAFPTKVTVDPLPATYELPAYVELLRALFEQDRLTATLLAEDNQSIEAKPLYERVRAAVDVKGAYGLVDQRVRASETDYDESVVAEEEAEPKPVPLRKILEETRAWPLANGHVLLLATVGTLSDPHTEDVQMSWNAEPRAFVVNPADGTRTRCADHDAWARARVRVDASGSALLVARPGVERYEAFIIEPKSDPCAFKSAGTIDSGESRGALSPTAYLARIEREQDGLGAPVVVVFNPDEAHPMEWHIPGCDTPYGLDWVGAEHVAVLCDIRHPSPQDDPAYGMERDPEAADEEVGEETPSTVTWVYFVDITTGEAFAAPWRDAEQRGRGLYRVPNATLQLLARSWDGTLELGTLTQRFEDLLAAPPVDTAGAPPPALTGTSVRTLLEDSIDIQVFDIDSSADMPAISPAGTHLSYTVDGGRRFAQNLAVFDLRTKTQTRVAINAWALHQHPAFTVDGSKLIFSSQYSLRDGEGRVAQIVDVP